MTFDEAKRRRTAADQQENCAGSEGHSAMAQVQTLLDFLPNPVGYRDHALNVRASNRSFSDLLQSDVIGEFDIPEDLLRTAGYEPDPAPQSTQESTVAADFAALGLDYRVDHLADRRADGTVAGFYTILSDHSGEREARQWQARLAAVADASEDAVIGRSLDGLITSWNRAAAQMFGYSAEEAIGRSVSLLFPIEKMAEQRLLLIRLAHGQRAAQTESSMRRRDGTLFDVALTLSAVRVEGAVPGSALLSGLTMVISDLTERRRLAAEVQYRTTHDSLTGLANRADFEKRLDRALASARERDAQHALLYVDLDQFQLVNEACGHTAGDDFLREASTLIQSCIRSRDTLARLGGDEFGVILEHCDFPDALEVAEKIRNRMDEFRFSFDGRKFRIGASIGLVTIDKSWEDAAKLLKAADTACYAAKEAGRDRVVSYFDVDGSVETRRSETAWFHLLDQAMAENHFTLYAQLIEPLQLQGSGVRCEILLRLKDGDGKLINPGEFLPAAERFRIMPRVDKWVVGTVIDFLTKNRQLVTNAEMISVNLSGKSIGDRNFQAFVQDRVAGSDFDREKLCFEITESESINNIDSSIEFIEKMREIGIRFSLDDFGTGVSSFHYLKKLPVDYIKIDGLFVENMNKDPVDFATVRSIQDVAKLLGKQTIAEFVEDAEVEGQLRDLGVDFMQGFLRHRPMPLENVFSVPGHC
jgi:diguanylate cyclase (GGDEF)-like protein/PAS domain S-box-containing protein